jgi:hypothetical protein
MLNRSIVFPGLSVVLLLCASSSLAYNANRLNGTADYALVNAKVYTMNTNEPWAEAVTVEGNKITYVGNADGLRQHIGLGTEVIDLEGKLVMPGFVDPHIHPVAGSILMNGVDLQTDDKEELFSRISQYVAGKPDDEVIRGYGVRFNPWTESNPTAAMLDEIESKRPIFFFAIDGHVAWVNSKSLEIAGVDKNTPDTVPGYSFFERDTEGNPTGWIIEVPAMMRVFSSLIELDNDYIKSGLEDWLVRMSAAGITAVIDYGIQGVSQDEGFELYKQLEKEGKFPIRLEGVHYWNDPEADPVPLLQSLNEKYSTDLIGVSRLKINMDGGDDKWNALFVDRYTDKPEVVVEPIIPYEIMSDALIRADALGFDSVCHCFGDGAVRLFLDAVEEAITKNPARDRRHTSSHTVLVHPEDVRRFSQLGVIYDVQAAWGALDPIITKLSAARLGEERLNRYIGINEMVGAGAQVSFSSDWPVSGYVSNIYPLKTIQIAVTRRTLGDTTSEPLGGESGKVALEVALRAHTMGGAYAMGMEDKIGSIEVGKLADLIVLDKNPFDVAPDNIGDIEVLYTVMDGNIVYESETE